MLSDEDFCNKEFYNNVVIPCRKGAQIILQHLKSLIRIPVSFDDDFLKKSKGLAWFLEEDDFDYMLDGSLDELIKKGYREIDCRLYEAGMKLNYAETERLLKLGGNPDVWISGDFYPDEAADREFEDIHCLRVDVQTRFADAIDCYDHNKYWKSGIEGKAMFFDENQVPNVLQGAAFCLMYLLICRHIKREE